MVANDKLSGIKAAIGSGLDWLESQHIRITPLMADLAIQHGIKTADYYLRVLMTWVNDLYNHEVSEDEFIDRMADVIEQQLTRAWNEGMRANGLDPAEDMLPEWQDILTEIIASEYAYVDGFAADIASGKFSLAQLQARANIWANRYNDVVNRAIAATADGKDRLIWVYAPEKQHCPECEKLDGIVAFAREWDELGVHPGGADNPMISCGGWNCGCQLLPTDKRRSPKAFTEILNIVTR